MDPKKIKHFAMVRGYEGREAQIQKQNESQLDGDVLCCFHRLVLAAHADQENGLKPDASLLTKPVDK